jgi:hypothetical protein
LSILEKITERARGTELKGDFDFYAYAEGKLPSGRKEWPV